MLSVIIGNVEMVRLIWRYVIKVCVSIDIIYSGIIIINVVCIEWKLIRYNVIMVLNI